MTGAVAPVLVALFIWWFSTGAILMVVKHADRGGVYAHLRSVLIGVPVLLAGVWGFDTSMRDASAFGVYMAFLSALAVWGWVELAFLSGIITGPNTRLCPPGVPEPERFLRAWGTIAYHETLLVLILAAMAIMSWDAPNPFGLWTFAVLFAARISAKLNLFFGVPKINVEFLPTPLVHLPSHFRIGRINRIYPVSITLLTLAVGCWLERLVAGDTPRATVGFSLLAALTALALLEHWFMVLPLPDEKLWRWMLPAAKTAPGSKQEKLLREDAHGL